MKKLLKLKMNLQMFADGDNGTGGDEGGNQTADSTPNTTDANQNSNNDDSDQDNQADTPFKSFASEKDWQS
ncbi:scaffolding protein, partial [Lactiplantibacillus plantarum]